MNRILKAALLLSIFIFPHSAFSTERLNILFITADDLNYDSLGCYGAPIRDITPHLDALAGQGIAMARKQRKPFLHLVNCTDPHRPFLTGPDDLAHGAPPSRYVQSEEITRVPGFLEDLLDIRRELAHYYTSVRRLDDNIS